MSAIGTKRTSLIAAHMSAYDPKRTLMLQNHLSECSLHLYFESVLLLRRAGRPVAVRRGGACWRAAGDVACLRQ